MVGSWFVKKVLPRVVGLGTVLTAAQAIINAAQENPAIRDGVTSAATKAKDSIAARNPYNRFGQKLEAIERCADLVADNFPDIDVASWRSAASALRTRGELVWHGRSGVSRKKAMKILLAEAETLLERVNATLSDLSQDVQFPELGKSSQPELG